MLTHYVKQDYNMRLKLTVIQPSLVRDLAFVLPCLFKIGLLINRLLSFMHSGSSGVRSSSSEVCSRNLRKLLAVWGRSHLCKAPLLSSSTLVISCRSGLHLSHLDPHSSLLCFCADGMDSSICTALKKMVSTSTL